MALQTCPHCEVRVVPTVDGICPSCRRPFHETPEFASIEPAEQELRSPEMANPYAAPRAAGAQSRPRAGSAVESEPWGVWLARLSWLLPGFGMFGSAISRYSLPYQRGGVLDLVVIMSCGGLIAGLAALRCAPSCGWRRVWAPIVIGLFVNGGILLLLIVEILLK